ncbi:hypothetical protein DMUE_3610 [Dictyocoela muelleri]|nr:hypothetical protein DMUE_3610 [Dictyocoela muelleri]
MYDLIYSSEKALLDQITDFKSTKKNFHEKQRHNKRSEPQKYCSYHNTNTHDITNCRANNKKTEGEKKLRMNTPTRMNTPIIMNTPIRMNTYIRMNIVTP